LAGEDRLAVPVDKKDRAQLRQRIDNALDALVQPRLLLADPSPGMPRTISLTSAIVRSMV
jgi:hypothetical protein